MWIDGKYLTECEVQAYIKEEREKSYRKGYLDGVDALLKEVIPELTELEEMLSIVRAELVDTLRKAATCTEGEDKDCSDCPYFTITGGKGCPSKLSSYAAKLRLEELCGEKS